MVLSGALPADENDRPRPTPELLDDRLAGQPPGLRHARGARRGLRPARTGSRCSRSSAGRSSARWPISAAIRSRWWPTSRQVLAGSIDADAADKAAHFIMVADSFHLPIVFLADNPGMLPGSRSERTRRAPQRRKDVRRADRGDDAEAARDAAQGLRLRVHGDVAARIRRPGRHIRLSRRHDGRDERRRAQPGLARRGGSVQAKLREAELQASFRSAEHLGFDELIDPRETRDALLAALQRGLYSRQAAAEPVSRIGIMP